MHRNNHRQEMKVLTIYMYVYLKTFIAVLKKDFLINLVKENCDGIIYIALTYDGELMK